MKTKVIEEDVESIVNEFDRELSSLEDRSVLITGANGFIPSYIVDVIHRKNRDLKKPCRMFLYNKSELTKESRLSHLMGNEDITFLKVDVGKPFEVLGNPDVILHAASRANPSSFLQEPIDTIDANVNATRLFLDYCFRQNPKLFLFFSSAEIYGNPSKEFIPTPETYFGNVDCLGPRACYSESKRFSESLCSNFSRKYGVDARIARIFHTFGPGIRDDGKAITDFFNQAYREREIKLRDEGESRISFAYVSDTVRGILRIMFNGASGEAYNVGSDLNLISMKELASKINQVMGNGSEVQTTRQVYRDGYKISERCPDLKKLRGLGFNPLVSLDRGLEKQKQDYYERLGLSS